MNQTGQILLILILAITVALAIGLSIVQKSLLDVSTSTKVEQSSKAFSAAEAGIEKSLQTGSEIATSIPIGDATLQRVYRSLVPLIKSPGSRQDAFEYPPLNKEDIAHVWLADPLASLPSCSSTTNVCYSQPTLDILWGALGITNNDDKPAIEIKVVYYDGSTYKSQPYNLDSNGTRYSSNGFTDASSSCTGTNSITTTSGNNRPFFCKYTLTFPTPPAGVTYTFMLLRARILYSSTAQPFAAWASSCPQSATSCNAYSLPSQATILTSIGTSGNTQRTVQVFQEKKVVPFYFDYAIFSSGEIKK